eukprot:14309-Heterococcus_DN1.PRE.3
MASLTRHLVSSARPRMAGSRDCASSSTPMTLLIECSLEMMFSLTSLRSSSSSSSGSNQKE